MVAARFVLANVLRVLTPLAGSHAQAPSQMPARGFALSLLSKWETGSMDHASNDKEPLGHMTGASRGGFLGSKAPGPTNTSLLNQQQAPHGAGSSEIPPERPVLLASRCHGPARPVSTRYSEPNVAPSAEDEVSSSACLGWNLLVPLWNLPAILKLSQAAECRVASA